MDLQNKCIICRVCCYLGYIQFVDYHHVNVMRCIFDYDSNLL